MLWGANAGFAGWLSAHFVCRAIRLDFVLDRAVHEKLGSPMRSECDGAERSEARNPEGFRPRSEATG